MEGCEIATTSADLAATVLDCFAASGANFAVLHGEAEVAGGRCSSDVDLVTSWSAHEVVARAHGHLRCRGLHPVIIWPYDVGSASVFVVDDPAREGAQFDILHDWSGSGHYGVRAQAVLAHAQPGLRWPRAAPEDELLYLLRKRHHKRQHERLHGLLDAAGALSGDLLHDRANELFSPSAAAVVSAILDGRDQPADRLRPLRQGLANTGRVASRLRRAVGFWVAVSGAGARPTAELIAARFHRVLPVVRCGAISGRLGGVVGDVRRIVPVRWRAGLYSSWGPPPAPLRPDLVLDGVDGGDRVLPAVVAAMERRLRL